MKAPPHSKVSPQDGTRVEYDADRFFDAYGNEVTLDQLTACWICNRIRKFFAELFGTDGDTK